MLPLSQPHLPIGVFDSGVGGLTVLHAIQKALPNEHIIYLGDTARLPYGTKSSETIQHYALQAAQYLENQGIKLLVMACNSATANALTLLKERLYPIPVIGVIEPSANLALQISQSHHIGIIATESTINSRAYEQHIHQQLPNAELYGIACPLLVSLAEEGWVDEAITEAVIRKYLAPFATMLPKMDTLILGCTHFPVFKHTIEQVCSPSIHILDCAHSAANAVAQYLNTQHLQNKSRTPGTVSLRVTDNPERFKRVAELFLHTRIDTHQLNTVDLHFASLNHGDAIKPINP